MKLTDAWRLFGPNLQTSGPAALVEVAFEPGEDVLAAVAAWKGELSRMAREVGLPVVDAAARTYKGGAVLTFSAAIDTQLAATDVSEWAAMSAVSILEGKGALPLEPQRTTFLEAFAAQTNPRLLALEAETLVRGVPLVWDEDTVTVGGGRTALSWPKKELPEVGAVPWDAIADLPIALVTGTNGKTTSVRLLARILKHAGHVVGMTTTDGVWVGEACVEAGDYTGPAGAVQALRSPAVDAAVLETARGGILRRGLALRSVGAALLTNVSEDHLGHYGIDDLETLARVKAVIGTVVRPSGRVVVNADDIHLLRRAPSFSAPLTLFSVNPDRPVLAAHVAAGGDGWTAADGWIVRRAAGKEERIVLVAEVPVTFGGAAAYNVANALGAAATASALGAPDSAIADGLRSFTGSATDNPGRGNLHDVGGVQVLVDFAHNPAGIRSVLELARSLAPSARLGVVAGYAGDRSDESLREAARVVAEKKPEKVWLRDLRGYLRGRAEAEVPRLFQEELVRLGLPHDAVEIAASEGVALRRALEWAQPGDFVVVLAHLETGEVGGVLSDFAARPPRS
jgi:UDP-N-acetylmuramyl tripeptide synthase